MSEYFSQSYLETKKEEILTYFKVFSKLGNGEINIRFFGNKGEIKTRYTYEGEKNKQGT